MINMTKDRNQINFIDDNPHDEFLSDLNSLQSSVEGLVDVARLNGCDSRFVGDLIKVVQTRLTLLKKDHKILLDRTKPKKN